MHIETTGSGSSLVLIHGWGMHGGMWGGVVRALARRFRVHCVDLPGHGNSVDADVAFTLDSLADALSATFDAPVSVCGWSLGGQIALRWARRFPQQVSKLILVASTPCFAERVDWPYGMAADTLRQFSAELERDHAATLRRFLALQVRGSEHERALLADLRARLMSRGEPKLEALRAGLAILRDEDMRAELPAIHQPTLLIAGGRDRLTPPEASRWMAETLAPSDETTSQSTKPASGQVAGYPAMGEGKVRQEFVLRQAGNQLPSPLAGEGLGAQLIEIAHAAHAPFLSHPDLFLQHVTEFLHG